MNRRDIAVFLLASLAVCGAVFRSALWGGTLLAPLDLIPAFCPHYRYLDPATDMLPANHYIIDQVAYDLPFQFSIYHAYRRGEMPWWDPYSFGGRPLLADAHCNAADPVRQLLYLTVPSFVLAYNWTLIVHSILTGLGLFCLLRWLGLKPVLAGGLALAGQCAGWTAIYFAHPWIQATFLYYPWLWIAWLGGGPSQPRIWRFVTPLLVCAILLAGNLQSHAYLPCFALAFCLSPVPWTWRGAGDRIRSIAPGLVIGGMLASPILLPELELYRLNVRKIIVDQTYSFVDGPLLLSNFYPWILGTFRSMNLRNSLGFQVYIGSIALGLAAFGAFVNLGDRPQWITARRLALAVLLGYLLIACTRLQLFLYLRISGLPAVALVVLAAFGTTRLVEDPARYRRWWRPLAALVVLIPLVSYTVAWWIYPRWLEPMATQMKQAQGASDWFAGLGMKLRLFQVQNYPHEITFGNPEVLCAWLGLILFTLWLAKPNMRGPLLPLLLALNLLPPLLFVQRFIVRADVALWHGLVAGGEEQNKLIDLLRPRELRLQETAPSAFGGVFPRNFAHFYRIHALEGYSTLYPRIQGGADPLLAADYHFISPELKPGGILEVINPDGSARFSWLEGDRGPVRVTHETLNRLELQFPAGPAAALLRTDTFYPGWHAETSEGAPLKLAKERDAFTRIEIPAGATTLRLTYEPRGLRLALALSALGLVGMVLLGSRRPIPQPSETLDEFGVAPKPSRPLL
jgi:hypothetical protein